MTDVLEHQTSCPKEILQNKPENLWYTEKVLVALPKWISPRYKNFDGTLFQENKKIGIKERVNGIVGISGEIDEISRFALISSRRNRGVELSPVD